MDHRLPCTLSVKDMMYPPTKSAKPDLVIAVEMAKAQAMVMSTSHEKNLVYFFGENMRVQAMMIVVTQAKKNMSNFRNLKFSVTMGNSPTVAPIIIMMSRAKAKKRFLLPMGGSKSPTRLIIQKTRLSFHVG